MPLTQQLSTELSKCLLELLEAILSVPHGASEFALVDSDCGIASSTNEMVVRLKPSDRLLRLATAAWALNGNLGIIEHREVILEEAARLRTRLINEPDGARYAELYAAQQALSWALQPEGFAAPYEMLTGTPEGRAGCPAEPRPPLS